MSGTCECGVYVPYIKGLWAKRLCVWQQQAFKGFSTHTHPHTQTQPQPHPHTHARLPTHADRKSIYIYIEYTQTKSQCWSFSGHLKFHLYHHPITFFACWRWLPNSVTSKRCPLNGWPRPNPNPKPNTNTKLKPKPEYKPHLTPLLLRTSSPSDMCSITSVLQNVFYLHRLAEFISFFMQHQRFMCLLEGMLWLC